MGELPLSRAMPQRLPMHKRRVQQASGGRIGHSLSGYRKQRHNARRARPGPPHALHTLTARRCLECVQTMRLRSDPHHSCTLPFSDTEAAQQLPSKAPSHTNKQLHAACVRSRTLALPAALWNPDQQLVCWHLCKSKNAHSRAASTGLVRT